MDSRAYRYPPDMNPETEGVRKPPTETRRWVRRLRTSAVILVGLVALYALLGFLAVPAYLRAKVPATLSEQLGHRVTVGAIGLNPFTLALRVKEFDVWDQDHRALVGFEDLYVNVELSSLVNRALTFDHIHLHIPYGRVTIRPDGSLNLSDLRPKSSIASAAQPTAGPAEASPAEASNERRGLPSLIIRSLDIERGVLEFHDESQPTPFSLDVVPVWLALKNFRTVRAGDNAFSFRAELEAGESLEWQGTLWLNPVRSDGHVTISGLKARGAWEYIQDRVGFEITDGRLHAAATYHAEAGNEGFHGVISDGQIRLDRVRLVEKAEQSPLLVLPAVSVTGIHADLTEHHLDIGTVHSNGARIESWITKEGTINFRELLPPAHAATDSEASTQPSGAERQATPWTVTVKDIGLEDYAVFIEDRRPPSPVRLDLTALQAHATNVTYPPSADLDLAASMQVNETGRVATSGTVHANPIAADLNVEVTQLPLTPFQPYIGQAANLELRQGSADLSGRVGYMPAEKQSVHFHGDASVHHLATVDSRLNTDLINWESLSVKDMDLALPTQHITIGEVRVIKPYADIVMSSDRELNIRRTFNKSDRSASGPGTSSAHGRARDGASPLIKVGSVNITGGSAHFADFSVQPAVDTGIFSLKGTIKGLSSEDNVRARVSLHGEVDKHAPVTIAGQINPLSDNTFTDLKMTFKNVDLTTLSPYSRKFAGYPIINGQLSMDLHYTLEHKILEAHTDVVVKHLTLGDKVESPEATSLPVKLAVALLKDRQGRIDIDLPVKGDLSNPEFQYGQLIWDAFRNLITKIVTSPFTLLAKLVGGTSDELSAVAFPFGSAALTSKDQARLKALATSLEERPHLQVQVSGTAHPTADRAALKEAKLQDELEALKQEAARIRSPKVGAARRGDPGESDLLTALYVQKFGDLPVQGGRQSAVRPDQLKERLLDAVSVDEPELHVLAEERAKQIQRFLIHEAGVRADRVFLLDPKLDGQVKNGMVTSQLSLTAG